MAPISQAISETLAFKPRSNGSAGLALSSYMGFSQMSFMFLTGAPFCLIGWNLFTEEAKSEFGWGMWTVSALPAAIFILLFLFAAIHLLFRLKEQDRPGPSLKTLETQLEVLGPLAGGEWLSLAVLALVIVGWLGKPLHGINEAWAALGAVLVFLITGVLDKSSLKNNIDWGCLLLLGVLSSLAVIMPHLKVDRWLTGLIDPLLSAFSLTAVSFLVIVNLLAYFLRFFLNKTTVVILSVLSLTPWAQDMGIHPGVLLLATLMGTESWFLPYQTDSYQIVYYSTEEKAFSHAQARKLMVAKFFATILAITISVPYWRMLGLIK
jgi:di/tricarboxylate transporter